MYAAEVSAMLPDVAGVLGIIAGVVGIASATTKRRAFALGIVALAFGFVAASVGVIQTALDRREVDRGAAEIAVRGTRQIAVFDGYVGARSRASRGARDATLPLLLGAIAALVGTRKSESPVRRWTTAVATGVALFTTAGAWAAARAPLPKNVSRATADLLDARDRIDTDFPRGCLELESAATTRWNATDKKEWPRRLVPDPRTDVPDFDLVATRCIQQRFMRAVEIRGVDDLLESPLLVDDALRDAMRMYMPPCTFACVPSGDPDDDTDGYGHLGGPWPLVKVGAPTTSSRATDLGTVMRLHRDRIRRCYGIALRKHATERFETKLKLAVGPDTHVTSATFDPPIADDDLSTCVLGVVKTIRFFADDAPFTIDFPIRFIVH